jgi:hypothetical protein
VLVSLLVTLAILSTEFVVPGDSPATQPLVTAVRGRLPAQAITDRIDREISRRLEKEGFRAAPLCDDSEFIRRAYLDLVGAIPTADKVKEFLASTEAEKRTKLIDELLDSPQFGRHLAEIWEGMLLPRGSDNRKVSRQPLLDWLARGFNENKPWDKFSTELLTASGSPQENGATLFYLFNDSPDKITDTVSRVFLGVQLQCAQCHNHPFTSWKQDEYWGMAAFFMKVKPNINPKKAQKQGIPVVISENPVRFKGKKQPLPESARIVPPRFLQGEQPAMDRSQPYRPVFAEWLVADRNPYFARAMVNRMWAHFFGRGLVNPIDDMHDGNAPSHPELLAALAEAFKDSHYDLKQLIRGICASQAYQRTSRATGGKGEESELFGRMAIKALTPEQLYDSLTAVMGERGRGGFGPKKGFIAKGPPRNPRDQFLAFFRTQDEPDPTEYSGGIPQALRLMNSPLTAPITARLLDEAMQGGRSPEKIIEHMYLGSLARRPTPQEAMRLTAYVQRTAGPPRAAYADILWAILNSSEFTLNH